VGIGLARGVRTMAEQQASGLSSVARVIDYLFGRNALIAVASFMLLCISGYATWSGMNDFIVGSTTSGTGRELPGGFAVSHTSLVVAITVALTFLMWLALRESFGAHRRWTERLISFPLYVFLALWSIGFGYGFWWSLISGEEATRTSLSSLQEDARDAGGAVAARLDAVKAQLDNVVTWSDGQMAREETSGGSCGVASGAGKGPLYNARRSVRDSVAGIRDTVTKSWVGPLQVDLEDLQKSAASVAGGTPDERQKRFEDTAANIRGKARNIAARSNELGKSTAAEMRSLADTVSVAPGQGGFSCHDPALATRLRQAADQAAEPAKLQLRQAAFNEGPAGVANAVKNLWANMGTYMKGLATYAFSGGNKTIDWAQSGDPITGRDMIALLATIGIDLGLLALALLDPPHLAPIRRDGLAASQAKLHLPPAAVVRQLAGAFETAIARAPDADLEWVRQHFLHHAGASYFVIPNIYSVDHKNKDEEKRAIAMNQLAGVFGDLGLIRVLDAKELLKFGKEEERSSYTDLTIYSKKHGLGQRAPEPTRGLRGLLGSKANVVLATFPANDSRGLRNHGLLSKAQRTLDIAGWSTDAQSDVELFRLTDTEGLTPLLTLMNEATLQKGADSAAAAADDALKRRSKPTLQIENNS
jgi:hypothetical protein